MSEENKTDLPENPVTPNPPEEQDPASAAPAESPDPAADAADASPDASDRPDAADASPDAPVPEPKPDETAQLRDRLLRLQADFDNYRKRQARDRQDLVAQAGADVLESMLAPMDHLELAIDTFARTAAPDDPFLKGIRMVRDEMLAAFGRFSLVPIETAVGAELDPTCEEALGLLPAPGIEENHVAVVVRKGYRLHGKVLRAAQVMVGAGTPAPADATPAHPDEAGASPAAPAAPQEA